MLFKISRFDSPYTRCPG